MMAELFVACKGEYWKYQVHQGFRQISCVLHDVLVLDARHIYVGIKSRPGVNYISVLRATFSYKSAFLTPKFCTKALFLVWNFWHQNHALIILMKLTPVKNVARNTSRFKPGYNELLWDQKTESSLILNTDVSNLENDYLKICLLGTAISKLLSKIPWGLSGAPPPPPPGCLCVGFEWG